MPTKKFKLNKYEQTDDRLFIWQDILGVHDFFYLIYYCNQKIHFYKLFRLTKE